MEVVEKVFIKSGQNLLSSGKTLECPSDEAVSKHSHKVYMSTYTHWEQIDTKVPSHHISSSVKGDARFMLTSEESTLQKLLQRTPSLEP